VSDYTTPGAEGRQVSRMRDGGGCSARALHVGLLSTGGLAGEVLKYSPGY